MLQQTQSSSGVGGDSRDHGERLKASKVFQSPQKGKVAPCSGYVQPKWGSPDLQWDNVEGCRERFEKRPNRGGVFSFSIPFCHFVVRI